VRLILGSKFQTTRAELLPQLSRKRVVASNAITTIGLDRYRCWVSANTFQYWWISVSADTYLSIGADTSSPVVRLPVSAVNIVATHAYIVLSLCCIFAQIPHIHI